MVFFYRRFLPLDVFIYAFGAENGASSSNLPIPFIKLKRLSQIWHLRQPLSLYRLIEAELRLAVLKNELCIKEFTAL